MKLGIIISVYNGIEFLEECLKDWIALREKFDIKIAVVDCLFSKFSGETPNSNDGTVELLEKYAKDKKIDFFRKLPSGLEENQARNVGIGYLINNEKVSHILTTAPDEIFSKEQIEYLINYLSSQKEKALFYIDYKNYVGSRDTYILGFCPKRIWVVDIGNFIFNGLIHDDDGVYFDKIHKKNIIDSRFPSETIPNLKVKHYSWLDGETSRKKIEYQKARNWLCSYKIENGKVSFNEEFYKANPQIKTPVIYHE